MKRSEIDKLPTISTDAKLVLDWLCRRPARAFTAKEVGTALDMHPSHVVDAGRELSHPRVGFAVRSGDYQRIEILADAPVRAAWRTDAAEVPQPTASSAPLNQSATVKKKEAPRAAG